VREEQHRIKEAAAEKSRKTKGHSRP